MRQRVVGSRIEHRQEGAGRFNVTPQHMKRQPEIVAGGKVVQAESKRFAAPDDSFLELAEGTMHFRQRCVIDSHAGLQRHSLADQPRSQRVLPLMMAEYAEKMKGIGMIEVFVQDPLIQRGRASRSPAW